MNRWEELLRTAILGTERQKLSDLPLPLGLETIQIPTDVSPEKKLLILAAIESSYQKAGYLPAVYEAAMPATFPQEWNEEFTREQIPVIRELFMLWNPKDSTNTAFLYQILLHLEQKGDYRLFPGEMLKETLDLCLQINKSNVSVHDFEHIYHQYQISRKLFTRTGARGEYLATLNPAWKSIRDKMKLNFDHGTMTDRIFLLHELLQTDETEAFQLLKSEWKDLNGEEKEAFVHVILKHGNIPEELTFWESVYQKEKRAKLKQQLLTIVLQFPQSSVFQKRISQYKNGIADKIQIIDSDSKADPILTPWADLEYMNPKLTAEALGISVNEWIECCFQNDLLHKLWQGTARSGNEEWMLAILDFYKTRAQSEKAGFWSKLFSKPTKEAEIKKRLIQAGSPLASFFAKMKPETAFHWFQTELNDQFELPSSLDGISQVVNIQHPWSADFTSWYFTKLQNYQMIRQLFEILEPVLPLIHPQIKFCTLEGKPFLEWVIAADSKVTARIRQKLYKILEIKQFWLS